MEERERWKRRSDFIFASIGAAIGLGNVWRFPYVTYQYGGGAFLIPYFVALITAGIPLVMLELGVGRIFQAGAPQAFARIRKKLEWVGWLALLAVMIIFLYYSVIMGWVWNYLYYSLKLSWGADPRAFFYNNFLKLSPGPGTLGAINWAIVIGLALSWLWSYNYLRRGTKSISKEIYWTVTIPWIILVIMVIRGLTLPGAVKGLNYYLTPDFKALLNTGPWLAAYGQVFFSLSLAMGSLIIYSSYLPRESDIANNAFIISLADAGTAFFAGFAVFSTLGYLAQTMGLEVPNVISSGFGLAFITYPTAISKMPFAAPFFGVIFFVLLLTLSIDSQISQVEPFAAGFMDKWKFARKKVLPLVVLFGFLGGLFFTTQGGYYWIDIFDYFTCSFVLTFVGLMEAIIVGYVFKASRMREYINEVSEIKIGKWWDICVKFITPIILGFSFIWELKKVITKGYGDYPRWTTNVGFALVLLLLVLSIVLMSIKGKEEQ